MNNRLIGNFKKYFGLSIISFFLSFFLINILSLYLSLNLSLKIVLIFLFFFNFIRIKKIYNLSNNFFFLSFTFLIFVSRILEFNLFNYFYNEFLNKNLAWLLAISISFIFKFTYLEFTKKFFLK